MNIYDRIVFRFCEIFTVYDVYVLYHKSVPEDSLCATKQDKIILEKGY